MKKYFVAYLVDIGGAGMGPGEVFKVVDAESIAGAYRSICQTKNMRAYGETPASDEEALLIIHGGKNCSLNFCFLLPDRFNAMQNGEIASFFNSGGEKTIAEFFASSPETISGTNALYPPPIIESVPV